MLKGENVVEDAFGDWPSFHDAEILKLELDRSGPALWLHLLLQKHGGPAELTGNGGADDSGPTWYEATLRFDVVDDLLLEDFNHQNVIWNLAFTVVDRHRANSGSDVAEKRLQVEIESVFGARCSFTCSGGEVTAFERTELRTGHPG